MIEARIQQHHIVHKHSGEVAEVIQMHQKFDAHGHPRIRRHVHALVHPSLVVGALMEDRLQDVAIGVRDVGVLPVELDEVHGAGPVPEAQRASTSRYGELLIKGTVSRGLGPRETAKAVD